MVLVYFLKIVYAQSGVKVYSTPWSLRLLILKYRDGIGLRKSRFIECQRLTKIRIWVKYFVIFIINFGLKWKIIIILR